MEGPSTISRRESAIVFISASVAVLVLLTAFSGFFESYDYLRLHAFNLEYLRNSLLKAKIPFWNPYVGLGVPFAANPEVAVFYPFTWLIVIFGPTGYCAVSLAFHFGLAAVSLLHFTRYLGATRSASWLSVFVFLASAQMFNRLSMGHLGLLNTACYLPLIFYLTVRLQDDPNWKRCAQLALALGFQILSGHPQVLWMTVIGAFLFLIGRRSEWPLISSLKALGRDAAFFICGVVLAAGIGGVILLPLHEYAGESLRASVGQWYMNLVSMNGSHLAGAFYEPWILLGKSGEASYYMGVISLAIGMTGLTQIRDRNIRGLWLVIVAAIALGMTVRTPLFELLKVVVPGYTSFRAHARFGLLLNFALTVALALGLSQRRPFAVVAGSLVVVFVSAGWLAHLCLPAMKSAGTGGSDEWRLFECALLIFLLLAAWHKANTSHPERRRPMLLLLCLCIGVDVGGTYYRAKANEGPFMTEFPLEGAIKSFALSRKSAVPPRILISYEYVRSNFGLINGYSSPSFFIQLPLRRVWYYLHQYLEVPLSVDLSAFPNLKIFSHGPFPYRTMNLSLGYDSVQERLVENPAPDPRAYLVGTVVPSPEWKDCIQFQKTHPNDRQVAYCESPADALYSEVYSTSRATITEFLPERIKLHVKNPNDCMLVLSESYYPGWKARIDNHEIDCVPLNVWMRGVRLPAGERDIEVFYPPTVFKWGASVSLASLAIVFLLLGKKPRKINSAIQK